MRLKAVKFAVAALAVAGLGGTAAALATPGKGSAPTTVSITTATTPAAPSQKPTTGAGCRPMVMLIVKGTTSAGAGPSSLSLNVTGGNHFAKLLVANNASTALTVNTNANTKVTTGSGATSTLGAIDSGDTVLAQYRVCKASLTGATTVGALSTLTTSLTAKKVVTLG